MAFPRMIFKALTTFGVLTGIVFVSAGCARSDHAVPEGREAGAVVTEIRAGTPSQSETLMVKSRILADTRPIYVQLPPGYEFSRQRYPLLYVMDAEWLFDLAAAHIRYYSFDEVTDEKMPRTIVVGIPNKDRDRDFTPTPVSGKDLVFPTAGKAANFLHFLEQELIPLIDRRYRTLPGRAIVGWSFSGLFSAYAAVEKPDLFNAHLCISPAIWWDHELIFRRMQAMKYAHPKRIVLTLGSGEAGGWVYESTKRLLRRLEQDPVDGLSVAHFEFEKVGHTWGVASAMDKGLQALFEDYIAPPDIIAGGMQAVDDYYGELSHQWGYPVVPPGKVLRAVAGREWDRGRRGSAIEILKGVLVNDPQDSLTLYRLGLMCQSDGNKDYALTLLRGALEAERQKPVPNEVNMREYREALAGLSERSGPER